MSNHDGSNMINSILRLLEEYNFFGNLDDQNKEKFINQILTVGYEYDCNAGEILEDLGAKLSFCYYCEKLATEFAEDHDMCKKCFEE